MDEQTQLVGANQNLQVEAKFKFSSPLPPPDMLERYERLSPRATDRILTMAEKRQEHRHVLEKQKISNVSTAIARGQWFGFVISLLTLAVGTALILCDKDAYGLVALLSAVATLLSQSIFRYVENIARKKPS